METFIYETAESFHSDGHIAGRELAMQVADVQRLYLEDDRPWVIGYSGGKDSTAILQLIYYALTRLDRSDLHKSVFAISSDTLVETPLVVDLVKGTLAEVTAAAEQNGLPFQTSIVVPKTKDTFWVNLLGKGYPAPTRNFRWCTERMKIDPVSDFILSKVAEFGEVIVVLGSRRQESSSRAQVIAKHKVDGTNLGRHTSLPNAFVYMPIEDWSADDVWEYLMSAPRPWGGSNRPLLDLYKGSNAGECPLVIDTSTPSCGNSRFGCWTCTVVTTDKAMESLVEQGEDWMRPLLTLRNVLSRTTEPARKRQYRNHRRRTGKVSLDRVQTTTEDGDTTIPPKIIPGPYWMKYRRRWLRGLLKIERNFRQAGYDIDLITNEELHLIRSEWLNDPNEPDWEDRLPNIYRSVYGTDLDWAENDAGAFTKPDAELLGALGEKYGVSGTLVQKLLELEVSMDGLAKRRGLVGKIGTLLRQDWDDLETVLSDMGDAGQSTYEEELIAVTNQLSALREGT